MQLFLTIGFNSFQQENFPKDSLNRLFYQRKLHLENSIEPEQSYLNGLPLAEVKFPFNYLKTSNSHHNLVRYHTSREVQDEKRS